MRWIRLLLVAAWTALMLSGCLVGEVIVLAIAAFTTVLLMPVSAMILADRIVKSINRWAMSGGRWDMCYSYGIAEALVAFAASGFILTSDAQQSLWRMAKKLVHGTAVAFRYANGVMPLLQPHELVLMLNLANDKAKFVKEHSLSDKMNAIVTDDGHMHFFDDAGEDITDLVKSIGDGVFTYCSSLTSITIPDSVKSIGKGAFYYCTSLKSIIIPDSVESIGDSAFYNCESLTSITIPDSVKSIEKWAFGWCASLKSIVIPDSVKSIGHGAFSWCESLKSIVIPDSVERIEEWAFRNCTSLASIIFKGKTLEEVQSMENYPWEVEDESVFKAEKNS